MNNRAAYSKGQLLGVHVVSEYVFCPRAMLTTHAHTCEDHGEEPAILRLDYAPCYDVLELEAKLAKQSTLLWQLIVVVVAFTVTPPGESLNALDRFFSMAGM